MEVNIDGTASTLTATPGQSSEPGFGRFPQTLSGSLPIAFGGGAPAADSVVNASLIVGALQRESSEPLAVSLVSLDDLLGLPNSGLVVGASEEDSNSLAAPLRLTQFRAVPANAVSFGVGVSEPYAVLEAFANDGRNLIMLGSWAPSDDLDAASQRAARTVADYTYSTPGGWNELGGDLLVSQPGLSPVTLESNAVVPQEQVTGSYGYVVWWAVGIVALLFMVGMWRVWAGRRYRRRLATYVDAQQTADSDHEQDRDL
ncbi:MAG: hypothetical protein HQ526_11605 [Actinobacteria bacterium]|nr:hypothetical protein [Actinomycetota bacterium]